MKVFLIHKDGSCGFSNTFYHPQLRRGHIVIVRSMWRAASLHPDTWDGPTRNDEATYRWVQSVHNLAGEIIFDVFEQIS